MATPALHGADEMLEHGVDLARAGHARPSIQITTAIPGPKSLALQARREHAIPRGIGTTINIFVESADGALVTDVDGNRYIDFAGGIGCLNIGHRHPEVVAAVHAQVDRYMHLCVQVTPYEPYIALAEKMNAIAPGPSPKKTFFLNSGAEAVENAVKIARAYTGREAILCFDNAFHGRTMFALALTSKTTPYKAGFGPFSSDVYRMPASYPYRLPEQRPVRELLQETFRSVVPAENVAAIMIEPVMGEGGFIVQTPEFMQGLREVCTENGIVLIADEIQSGFGRTGAMFACHRYGIEPDLLLSAKSMGGGLPIAAVTGMAEVIDAPSVGGIGGTFGGNPVSCAAALATINALEQEELPARAEVLGQRFQQRAREWQKASPLIGDVRGLGGMVAIELVRSAETQEPAAQEAKAIARWCHEHGLIILVTGTYGNVLRLLFPLTISNGQFEEGLQVMENAFAHAVPVAPAPGQLA